MKNFLLLLMLILQLLVHAQRQNAADVINAEKQFASYAVAHGTKAAFLHFADSNGKVFENGKAVNAIETWNKREARPGILNWFPIYEEIAASGDIGFTTGPWTFQPKTINDSIVARGQYSTIWNRTKSGEWKFLIDLGNSNVPAIDEKMFSFRKKKRSFTPGNNESLLKTEEEFIEHTKENTERQKWYLTNISKNNCLLNRNGKRPATSKKEYLQAINNIPSNIAYTIDGSGIAQGGDLGYVYGTTIINNKTENYLRIWRREGNAWKLAMEVLRF